MSGDGAGSDDGPPLGPSLTERGEWNPYDNVELTTVGIDVGSSTSHLMFARLHLQRLAQGLSSRFVVVRREVLHRSPVALTPYREDGLIDGRALKRIVGAAYRAADLAPEQVDSGAVILTGVALERRNAREVAELFAGSGGRFVCATAGHNLEAILAAHGSGAVARWRDATKPLLHLDIGGGTTKLAVVAAGEVLETAAIAVGGRLVTLDESGRVAGLEPAARTAAEAAGVQLELGQPLRAADRSRLCQVMADAVVQAAQGELGSLAERLMLTRALTGPALGRRATCSGGVSEYLAGGADTVVHDLGLDLAAALRAAFASAGCSLSPLPAGIRATAIGASQFTVQLSGSTIHLARPDLLPLRNLPVVSPVLSVAYDEEARDGLAEAIAHGLERMDIAGALQPLALALRFPGEPHYGALHELAHSLGSALGDHLAAGVPLVLALDADVGRSLGAVIEEELGPQRSLVVVDGLELRELDYIDLGEPMHPAGVVPVVIKSLAFAPRPACGDSDAVE